MVYDFGDAQKTASYYSPNCQTSRALKEMVGALGGSVTFPVESTVKHVNSIVWIFNVTTLVTIQPAVAHKKAIIIVIQNQNEERLVFPDGNYSLTLLKLKKNDSGIYRVEIYSSSSQSPFTQEYKLHVYEYLAKPKVTMGLQNNKNGTCITNLTCSMEQEGDDVTYSWKALGQGGNKSYNGSILPVSWRLGERDMTFICMARNPISSNSSSPILAWKLCKDADDGGWHFFLAILCLLLVILLLGILVAMSRLTMRKEREKEPIEGEKRMDLHQEIPNVGPHSGENTVYETIRYDHKINPEEDPLSTLYSTVQIPKKVENP